MPYRACIGSKGLIGLVPGPGWTVACRERGLIASWNLLLSSYSERGNLRRSMLLRHPHRAVAERRNGPLDSLSRFRPRLCLQGHRDVYSTIVERE